jgi:type IV pilus assembly protein PilY1
MNVSRRLMVVLVVSLLCGLAGIPILSPVREAAAYGVTVNWGTNTNGNDSVGGCVSPTGKDCSAGSTWGSGQSVSVTSGNVPYVLNIALDSGYTIVAGAVTLGGVACTTSSSTCKIDSATNPTKVTFPNVPSSTPLVVKITQPSTSWDVAYNVVDNTCVTGTPAGMTCWLDPPPASANHGSFKINTGGSIRYDALPDNTPVPRTGSTNRPVLITVDPDPYYAIQQVDKSTDGGATWTALSGAGVTGTDAATGGAVTVCATTSLCQWSYSPAGNTLVRAAFKPWSVDINVTLVTTAGNGSTTPAATGGKVTVTKNTDQTFTLTADGTSRIFDVQVQDTTGDETLYPGIRTGLVSIGSVSAYTFKNVSVNTNIIKVIFAPAIAPIANYCQTPAFLGSSSTSTVLPNVMLVADDSGSESYSAYTSDVCDTGKRYFGLFKTDRIYTYDSASKTYTDAGPDTNFCTSTGTAGPYSGNLLNLLSMTRVDVIRAALIGGKMKTGTRGTSNNVIEMFRDCRVNQSGGNDCGNVTNSDTTTKYYINAGATEPTGIVQELAGKVNFGLMFFNSGGSSDGGYVKVPISSTTTATDIVNALEGHWTPASTPLAETLYEATRYFQQATGGYNYGVTTTQTTAGNKAAYSGYTNPIQYSCQKNFVLIVTDGNANEGASLPGAGSRYNAGGTGSPLVSWSTCNSNNFAATTSTTTTIPYNADTWLDKIYVNEGNHLTLVPSGDVSSGNCTTSYLESVAYYAHTSDLRPAASSAIAMAGSQNLTIYGVFSFNDAGVSPGLNNACKYGAFKDTNTNSKPDQDSEWYTRKNADGTARTQSYTASTSNPCPNSTTCSSTGTTTSGTCTCKLADTYYSAGEGTSLKDALNDAMKSIIAQVSSGTAASILSNSSGFGANLLQAVFFPDKVFAQNSEITWLGEIQNLWFYVDPFLNKSTVHEDTDQDFKLNLSKDYTVQFNFDGTQTHADLLNYSGTYVSTGVDPDNVKSLWRAGDKLWSMSAASRNIYTYLDPSSTTLVTFKSDSATPTTTQARLLPYLQAAPTSVDSTASEAANIISYIRGSQVVSWRDRSATQLKSGSYVTNQWKLGDVISSTPRMQTGQPLHQYHGKPVDGGYGDLSYKAFVNSSNYKDKRGMVYSGANDGMFHAFKLGTLSMMGGSPPAGDLAQLTGGTAGNPLGGEEWAYIPRSALPYLRYLADPKNYNHIYYVDGTPSLVDASIKKPTYSDSTTCSETYYWNCPKDTVNGNNWKTVVIGAMGIGGASRIKGSSCTNCVQTPITDPADSSLGLGYSSYFALDITGQYFNSDGTRANPPGLLWEFNDPGLGYALSGPAIVRVSALTGTTPDKNKNGRWFAVFGSGPTGKITGGQFSGVSDQELKLYVVDIGATPPLIKYPATGFNYWEISTGIKYAFAGAAANGVIDADRSNTNSLGNYQDDAVYIGYTKNTDQVAGTGTWTDGGILRLVTAENLDPTKWSVSKVIDGIGPVTSNIGKLQDYTNHKLWLYGGTGRYFSAAEDPSSQRIIMGIAEPCYKQNVTHGANSSEGNGAKSVDAIDETCTDSVHLCGALETSGCVKNQTTGSVPSIPNYSGWYINLDPEDTANNFGAERDVSDPVTLTNGSVFFSTFKPTSDPCSFGGKTYLWGVTYNSGYQLSPIVSVGKVLQQQSTGAFNEQKISGALTQAEKRKTPDVPPPYIPPGGSGASQNTGKTSQDAPPVITNANLKPVKKILHMMER